MNESEKELIKEQIDSINKSIIISAERVFELVKQKHELESKLLEK
jgi:hypothetical protein